MNIEMLKANFLVGTAKEKNRFVRKLRPDYIVPTDITVTVNGVEEKLYYHSINLTYFDRYMTIYRECPVCGNIRPVSDFAMYPILPEQRYIHEGEYTERNEEFVCRECIEKGNFIVPCKDKANINAPIADNGFYLYRNPDESVEPDFRTVEFEYRNEEGEIVHGFTYESSLILQCGHSVRFVKWNYETGEREGTFRKQYHEGDNFDGIEVLVPGVDGSAYVTREEVVAHPEVWNQYLA